ncbi:MAG: Na+ dependent nucleoside transporter N-terminal domain-containing protein, partial [Woeseiaceae bacterium]
MQAVIGLGGIVLLFLVAFLLSSSRKSINRRTIAIAFALQVAIAALILY